jgi:hypothetical protein
MQPHKAYSPIYLGLWDIGLFSNNKNKIYQK